MMRLRLAGADDGRPHIAFSMTRRPRWLSRAWRRDPIAGNVGIDPTSLPADDATATRLMSH
jgi:hypothetical protein